MKFKIKIEQSINSFCFEDIDNLDGALNVYSIKFLNFNDNFCSLLFKAKKDNYFKLENLEYCIDKENIYDNVLSDINLIPIPLFDIYCEINKDFEEEFSKINISEKFNLIKERCSINDYLIYKFCYFLEKTISNENLTRDYNYDEKAIIEALLLIYFEDCDFFDNHIEIIDIENYSEDHIKIIKEIKCGKLDRKLKAKDNKDKKSKI